MKTKLQSTSCPLCGTTGPEHATTLFPANFSLDDITVATFSARRRPDRLHYRLVRCLHDGLVRSDPILSSAALAKLYQASTMTYHHEVPHLVTTYLEALQPVLKQLEPTANLLEIGCGNGFMLEALQQRGFENVFGVEPSTQAKSQAPASLKRRIKTSLLKPGLFKQRKFDLIFFFQTLDHVANPDEFIQTCYSLLKDGGHIVSFHHDIDSWSSRLLGEKSPIIDIEHTHLYSAHTTSALFEKHGFLSRGVTQPANTVSLFHLAHLIPMPNGLKKSTQDLLGNWGQTHSVRLPLGNLCYHGQKPNFSQAKIKRSRSRVVYKDWEQVEQTPAFDLAALTENQRRLRQRVLEYSHQHHLSHLGSCLTVIDAIDVVYQLKSPSDVFVLSNGHAGVAWFTVLEKVGLLQPTQTDKLYIHPDRDPVVGIEVSSGSLGQGLPIAVGMALADRSRTVWCMVSDGELEEGSMWESMRQASLNQLDNLKIMVNSNGWGAYGRVDRARLKSQLQGFGHSVREVDGHDYHQLWTVYNEWQNTADQQIVLLKTRVDQFNFLQGLTAHYHVMSDEQYATAIQELTQ